MTVAVKTPRASRVTLISSTLPSRQPLTRSVRLSQIGKMRECEQVAAVCYRERRGAIEFLLVQTRGSGRWIFPKGSAEPGLTLAQAAAIEAFEEAGVHGRIQEASFVRYVCRRQGDRRNAGRAASKALVSAHLCQVLRLTTPKEANRNRTWFTVEETTLRLREGRKSQDGKALARVVHRAVAHIKRLRSETGRAVDQSRHHAPPDELHRVQFEAPEEAYSRRLEQSRRFTLPAREILPCEVLPFATPRHSNRNPKLLSNGARVKALGASAKNG